MSENNKYNPSGKTKEVWDKLKDFANNAPEVTSLLYNMDLLPEQIISENAFFNMLAVVTHMQVLSERLQNEIISLRAKLTKLEMEPGDKIIMTCNNKFRDAFNISCHGDSEDNPDAWDILKADSIGMQAAINAYRKQILGEK